MAKKKRKYNLKSRITSALRKIWLYSPQRRDAVKAAKTAGNKCAACKKSYEKLEVDHVKPVVPMSGFDNWDNYVKRLFEGELICLCKDCHLVKTKIQRETRKKIKKALTT